MEIKDAKTLEFLWRNSGELGDGESERFKLKDALSVPNAPVLMPKVISNIVREAQEPLLIGTSLLQRINYKYGPTITFGAVGALQAADIAEGMEYPEDSMNVAAGTVTATIGKSGLAVKITEEMVKYSQFDVISMHLRAAGRALARHKEQKIFNMIRQMGVPSFDNINPATSMFGVTTGRDLTGAANGSLTMDDLFDSYGQVISQGFFPNTLLMHPLTWVMFMKDATLRAFVMQNGGGVFFATHTGNPAGRAPWEAASQGGLGQSTGQDITPGQTSTGATAPHGGTASNLLQYPQDIDSAPVLPNYFNVPFKIIVSPFVYYDPRRKLTDIYMFDSSELGVLIVDEEVTTEEWNDPKVDIMKIKLRERYALAILQEGKAIATLKNIHVVPNEVVLPAQATIDISGSIGPISPTASVLG